MDNLFLLDVFETCRYDKILLRCLYSVILFLVFVFLWGIYYGFMLPMHGSTVLSRSLDFTVCVILVLFQSLEKKELTWYSQIFRSNFRKHITLIAQSILSLSGQVVLSRCFVCVFFLHRNVVFVLGQNIFLYLSLLIYRGVRVEKKALLYLIIPVNISCAIAISNTVLIMACSVHILVIAILKNKYFFDCQDSLLGYSLLSSRFTQTSIQRSLGLEITFLFRVRKMAFVSALIFPLMSQCILIWYGKREIDLFNNMNKVSVQLFYSFATGGSAALLGSYIIPWLSFYFDDVLTKQISMKSLIRAHYVFFQLCICFDTVLAVLVFSYFNIPLFQLSVFLFLNLAFTTFSALFLGLLGLVKSDVNKSPKLTNDSGNMFSTWLPYFSCFLNVMVYSILKIYFSEGLLLTISIFLFLLSLILFPNLQNYFERMSLKINQKRVNYD